MKKQFGEITRSILDQFTDAVGAKNLVYKSPDILKNYAYGEAGQPFSHMSEVVIKVESTEHVSRVMKIAFENNIPVTPRGAGSGLPVLVFLCMAA